jgi:hypothetical protein
LSCVGRQMVLCAAARMMGLGSSSNNGGSQMRPCARRARVVEPPVVACVQPPSCGSGAAPMALAVLAPTSCTGRTCPEAAGAVEELLLPALPAGLHPGAVASGLQRMIGGVGGGYPGPMFPQCARRAGGPARCVASLEVGVAVARGMQCMGGADAEAVWRDGTAGNGGGPIEGGFTATDVRPRCRCARDSDGTAAQGKLPRFFVSAGQRLYCSVLFGVG